MDKHGVANATERPQPFLLTLAQGQEVVANRVSLALLRSVLRLRALTAYQPLPDLNIRVATDKEASVRGRWEAIRAELPKQPISFLDIGCNVGFYVIETAKLGHLAFGLDRPPYARVLQIVRNNLGMGNVVPIGLRLTPENVDSLPWFDCIQMLQVFHHLCRAYGTKGGLQMLETVYGKARRLFIFETESRDHSHPPFTDVLPEITGDGETWVHDHFTRLGCREVRTIFRPADGNRHHQRVVVAVHK
jgi:hypothetical protein